MKLWEFERQIEDTAYTLAEYANEVLDEVAVFVDWRPLITKLFLSFLAHLQYMIGGDVIKPFTDDHKALMNSHANALCEYIEEHRYSELIIHNALMEFSKEIWETL